MDSTALEATVGRTLPCRSALSVLKKQLDDKLQPVERKFQAR